MRIAPATPSWPFGVEPAGRRGRRMHTVATLGAGALVLLGAGAMITFTSDGGGGAPPGGSAASAGTVVSSVAVDPMGGGESALPANLLVVEPLLQPPAVTWRLFSGVALPFSPTDGPRLVDGPVYRGFEHSQTGALIAAAQLGTRYLLTPGLGWRQVTARQVLPGVGRDVYVAARAEVVLDDPPGSYGQLAGFRMVVAFTPDVAVLQLVSRFALTGRLQVTTSTLKWVRVTGGWCCSPMAVQPDRAGRAGPGRLRGLGWGVDGCLRHSGCRRGLRHRHRHRGWGGR